MSKILESYLFIILFQCIHTFVVKTKIPLLSRAVDILLAMLKQTSCRTIINVPQNFDEKTSNIILTDTSFVLSSFLCWRKYFASLASLYSREEQEQNLNKRIRKVPRNVCRVALFCRTCVVLEIRNLISFIIWEFSHFAYEGSWHKSHKGS